MELTRRQFIISGTSLSAALAFPAMYLSSSQKLKDDFNNFKDYTYEQVEQLDSYLIASVLPSIMSMLFLAYTLEMFSFFSTLFIIFLSLVLII